MKLSAPVLDFIMDFAALLLTQIALDRPHPAKLLRGMVVLAIGSTACKLFPIPAYILQFPLCLLCSAVLFGTLRIKRILEGGAAIIGFYAVMAGFLMLGSGAVLLLITGAVSLCLLLRRSNNLSCRWNIEVELRKNGLAVRFPALIDSGNRLHEHTSGLPVLIVQEKQIFEMVQSLSASECSLLPFGVLGSSGELKCFLPDAVYILSAGLLCPAPACWVASFPGKIPGMICALAPPEFADFSEAAGITQVPFQNTLRRFLSWRFQA